MLEPAPSCGKLHADRATGHKGKLPARSWEKQRRGLAHVHGVIAVGTPVERAWAEEYVTVLKEMAPRYGFGGVDGWQIGRKFWPGGQAGAYLSSYFARGCGAKMAITETVLEADLPRLIVFVGRGLTRRTRCSMRSLRQARQPWASREGYIGKPRLTYEAGLLPPDA